MYEYLQRGGFFIFMNPIIVDNQKKKRKGYEVKKYSAHTGHGYKLFSIVFNNPEARLTRERKT